MFPSLRLYQLNEYIRRVIALNFSESIWINCEIASFKESRGHAYLELIEKSDFDDNIIAQASAVIWRTQLNIIYKKLGEDSIGVLQAGKDVLIKVKVDFNEKYGLKLIIEDIDLSFTIGKLALKRQAILEELSKLKLIDKNKGIPLPKVFQRLAVISSPNAAGWGDFQNHIMQNKYGYKFKIDLFPSAMQGNLVEQELCGQMKSITKNLKKYDCVIIIRGGGGKVDLSDFDNLNIATTIAHCPIPVFTGIGHDIDESVADIVANTSHKTPTAVADFIVSYNSDFETEVLQMGWAISEAVRRTVTDHNDKINYMEQQLSWLSKSQITRYQTILNTISLDMQRLITQKFKTLNMELDGIAKLVEQLSPEAHFKRGYTITLYNKKTISDKNYPKEGEQIITQTIAGNLISTINNN